VHLPAPKEFFMKNINWHKMAKISSLLSVVGLVVVLAVSAFLESKSALAQRVEPHSPELAAVLGETGLPIGSPQRLVILDEKMVLETKPDGSKVVSETYLTQNNIYPLQWQTVEFVRNIALLALTAKMLLGLFVMWRFAPRAGAMQAVRT
jgi:hypothetical protein